MTELTFFSFLSIGILGIVYYFLITEKISKVIVAVLGAVSLIVMQVFRTASHTSQENAVEFISKNLDVLGFIVGMMVLVGIVRDSGAFEAVAIWLVKLVKGKPIALLVVFGYLSLFMTALLSNIPTILILSPVLIVLIKELKLPYLPYFFIMITMANIGGAMTPISDPTTYYQAKTVGLSFFEVVSNSGLIVLALSVSSLFYTIFAFRKELFSPQLTIYDVSSFKPSRAIRNKTILYLGMPMLFVAILLMVFKEAIKKSIGLTLDNASITLGFAFLAMLLFHRNPKRVFTELIDWEILFFFMGLFVVVGSLEFTHVIHQGADALLSFTKGDLTMLVVVITMLTSILSVFIDNVPLNITLVGAVLSMQANGVMVYPLWWAINLATSLGGAGSPIAAACNVVAFGYAEKENIPMQFKTYLFKALPLVIINALITIVLLWLRYLRV